MRFASTLGVLPNFKVCRLSLDEMESFVRHVAKESKSDVSDIAQLLILTALQSQPQDKINQTILSVVRVRTTSLCSTLGCTFQVHSHYLQLPGLHRLQPDHLGCYPVHTQGSVVLWRAVCHL